MNLNKRRLIFCTFIYSCAAIGLIGAGLGSKRWVVASARRTSNTTESVGQVNLGLFYGDKYLNIGYGLRTYSVDVIEMMKMDPDIMVYSLWALTVIGVLAGLIMAVAAAVFAVINSAITPISALAGIPGLYFWNISAMFFQLLAGSLWVGQYFQRLQYNVMNKDDRRNKWTSEGNASLGFSFCPQQSQVQITTVQALQPQRKRTSVPPSLFTSNPYHYLYRRQKARLGQLVHLTRSWDYTGEAGLTDRWQRPLFFVFCITDKYIYHNTTSV